MNINEIQMRPFSCHQSSISCAHGCERCWFFKERWGVELRGVKIKEGTDLGKIYHKFQQLGQGNQDLVKPWVVKMQTALMARVDKGEDLDGEMQRKASLLTVLYNKAEAMARLFWERYPTPSYLKTIGTEIKHKMTLTGVSPVPAGLNGMVLEGTIDKLVQDTRNGNIWIRDHKSTGMKTLNTIFAGFPWSPQARMYRILAKDFVKIPIKLPKPMPVVGFILDGIMKPGIKLCKKDDKFAKEWNYSVEDAYLRRVIKWYAEKDAIRSQAIMYNEPLFSKEFGVELYRILLLSKKRNDPTEYQRDPSRFHCFLYESECIYSDLCNSPMVRWPELFDNKYKIKEPEKKEDEKISNSN